MRATDLIRKVLDIVDAVEQRNSGPETVSTDDAERRFDQIKDLEDCGCDDTQFANEPREKIADIAVVTTLAGGGMNAPKHPMDLRVKDPSMYPGV